MANAHNLDQKSEPALRLFVALQNTYGDVRSRYRFQEERGASMAEYGLLLSSALIIASVVVALFGQRVIGLFEAVDTEFQNVRPTPSSPTP